MRKLWAYIVSIFTSLVIVGVTFFTVATKVSSNIEYERGREITFRISVNEKVETGKKEIEEGDIDKVAAEMKKRLDSSSITRYKIDTAGLDTVKVTLADEDYTLVSTLLEINGTLALGYGDQFITSDEFLKSKAYFETYNKYPCILLPVDKENANYKNLMQLARDDKNNGNHHEWAEAETGEDGETTTYRYFLYLVYNFSGNWSLEDLNKSDITYNRVLTKFEVTANEEDQYFPGETKEKNRLFNALQIGSGTATEKSQSYDQARYLVNLINCGPYEFEVKNMFEQTVTVAPWVETKGLVTTSNSSNHLVVAWSDTFAACVIAMVVLSILFAVYFRLGAAAIATCGVTSTFLGFLAVLLFNAEFNTLGVVALIIIAIASMACGTIYCSKLKNECYRGRSLKKANAEASKKSTWVTVDINLIPMVIGIFVYIFGGAIARGFAAIMFFGGLASLLLNLFVLKGLMYLITNSLVLQGKYEFFGVDGEKVPSLIKEEKQTYFGSFADRNVTKGKGKVGIIAAVLVAISTFGLLFFGIKNNGALYSKGTQTLTSEVYVETTTKSSELRNEAFVSDVLNHVYTYTDDISKAKAIGDNVSKLAERSRKERIEGEDIEYYFYIASLDSKLSSDVNAYYENGETVIGKEDKVNVNELLTLITTEVAGDSNSTISLKEVKTYYTESPQFGKIALGCLVAIAVLSVYFLLRYKLTRGLATFVVSLAAGVITTGILSVLPFLSIPSYVIGATPIAVAFVMMLCVIFMNIEKDILTDEARKDNSVEHRNEVMLKASGISASIMFPFVIFVLYTCINFFGFGPKATSWIYGLALFAVIFGAFAVACAFGPLSQVFYKWFHSGKKVSTKKKKHKTKAKPNKSAEPEEAIFIGIND